MPPVYTNPIHKAMPGTGGRLTNLKDPKTGSPEPFTRVPNRVLRSRVLSPYAKVIYGCIASCEPSFPSYEKLSEWSGMSRKRVWKSIQELKNNRLIQIKKGGKSNQYLTYWGKDWQYPTDTAPVSLGHYTSIPQTLRPVSLGHSIKNK